MVKESKSLKKTLCFLSLLILSVITCAISMNTTENNSFATVNAEVNTAEVTFDGTTTGYTTFAAAWEAATSASTNSENKATVKLLSDVTASGGSFGLTIDGSSYDYILISSGDFIILDLNGYTINRGLTSQTSNGTVISNIGNFTLNDTSEAKSGTIKGGSCTTNGGGVYNHTSSIFTMNGGTISDNTANYGGGVYNYTSVTFTMNGGTISGNTANNGGGVYNYNNATFQMLGGEIRGNTANYGGGVWNNGTGTFTLDDESTISGNTASFYGGGVNNNGVFTMNDGIISGNTAINGGGVKASQNTFTMNGGAISDNTANDGSFGGGIYIEASVFNLSGSASITNNVIGGTITEGVLSGGTANNIHLGYGRIITITDVFTGSAGVTMSSIGTFTNGWKTYGSISTGTFSSDVAGYGVALSAENEKYIVAGYNVTYAGNSNTSGSVPIDSNTYPTNDTVTVIGNTGSLARTGYSFSGWNYNNITYAADDTITVADSNITLTAVWTLNAPTISTFSGYSNSYDGLSHNISVTATHELSGTYSLTYQWYKGSVSNENKIADATSASYSVTNILDSGTYYCVVSITDGSVIKNTQQSVTVSIIKATNSWTSPVSITGWTYNQPAHTPSATAAFGTATYIYSNSEAGTYTETVPSTAGTWYVKAYVSETNYFSALNGAPISFTIAKAQLFDYTQALSFEYDKTAHSIAVTLSGFSNSEVCDATLTYSTTGENYTPDLITLTNVGNLTVYYKAVFDNYMTVEGCADLTVTKRPVSIVIDDKSSKEGADLVALTYSLASNSADVIESDNLNINLTKVEGLTSGKYAITGSYDNANYNVVFTNGTYTILVAFVNNTISSGANDKTFTVDVSNEEGFDPDYNVLVTDSYETASNSYLISADSIKDTEVIQGISLSYEDSLGNEIELENPVTVIMEIGSQYDSNTAIRIAKINNDGTLTFIEYSIENGELSFEADSTGTYAIVADNASNSKMEPWKLALIITASIIFCGALALSTVILIKKKKNKNLVK